MSWYEIKDGFSQLNNTLQAVLERLDYQQTALQYPNRPRKKLNLQPLSDQQFNTVMEGGADNLQIESTHSETDSQHPQTQDDNKRNGSQSEEKVIFSLAPPYLLTDIG